MNKSLTKFPTPLLLLISLLSLSACSQMTSFQAVTEKAGAGDVYRADSKVNALIPAGATIEKLAGGFAFTEGPVWHKRLKHLMFSDLRSNAIHLWDDENGLRTFMNPVFEGESDSSSVGSNGLNINSESLLILLEHGNRRVSRQERDGSITTLADNYQGKRLNSPNDSAWHSDGSLYFTDPPYGLARLEDDPARELDFNGIYRLHPDGQLELLESGQSRPNGIAFSPDEKTLYVANSDGAKMGWMAYDVMGDGSLEDGRVFVDANNQNETGAADGLKVDINGNLFASGPGGVWIIDPDGNHLGTIKPEEVPANVAWGDDGSTLYMTARTGLYRIRLSTSGVIP